MNIHLIVQLSPSGRFLGVRLLTIRFWILKINLMHSTNLYSHQQHTVTVTVTQGSPKGILSTLLIFRNLIGKIFSFHLYFGIIFMFMYRLIDSLYMQCLCKSLDYVLCLLLYLIIFLIDLICLSCIKSFLSWWYFFSVFHLSFNFIFDAFAKKKLTIRYAIKFIHFPWWFFISPIKL